MKDKMKKVFVVSLPVLFALLLMVTLAAVFSINKRLNDSLPALNSGEFGDFTAEPTGAVGGDVDRLPDIGTSIDTTRPIETTAAQLPETTAEPTPVGSVGLSYTSYRNGTCYVSGIGRCTDTFVVVPEVNEEGDRVIAVGANAFKNCKSIKGIELPLSVTSIGANAFYDSGLRSVGIHSLISSIGECAFGVCRDLISISVDGANAAYSDEGGVLYSKDRSVLICYPAGRSESTIDIAAGVREIRTMAFYGSEAVRMIRYAGTSSAWRTVEIGPGNEPITGAIVSYGSASGK